MRSCTIIVSFLAYPKSKMATMSSDWLRHFEHLKKNDCRYEIQSGYKSSLWDPALMLLSEPTEIQCCTLPDNFKGQFVQNSWMMFPSHMISQSIVKDFGEQNRFLGRQMSPESCQCANTRWPPWALIGWDILNIWRTTVDMKFKLGTYLPYEILH